MSDGNESCVKTLKRRSGKTTWLLEQVEALKEGEKALWLCGNSRERNGLAHNERVDAVMLQPHDAPRIVKSLSDYALVCVDDIQDHHSFTAALTYLIWQNTDVRVCVTQTPGDIEEGGDWLWRLPDRLNQDTNVFLTMALYALTGMERFYE